MLWLFLSFYSSFLGTVTLILIVVLVHLSTVKVSSLQPPEPPTTVDATQAKLDSDLTFWLKALEKQPSSRDTLNNISLIYQSKNNLDLAKKYKDEALKVDPNFSSSVNLK